VSDIVAVEKLFMFCLAHQTGWVSEALGNSISVALSRRSNFLMALFVGSKII
jgi:hypothetical protein